MILVEIIGGLGNQMFQYAAAKSLSISKKSTLKIDLSKFKNYNLHNGFELTNIFNINEAVASRRDVLKVMGVLGYAMKLFKLHSISKYKFFSNQRICIEKKFEYSESINENDGTVFMSGYWQSYKYFEEHENAIRESFRFRGSFSRTHDEWINRIQKIGSNSVSLHVRRGDYIKSMEVNGIHSVLPFEYYERAIAFMKEKLHNPVFFVFSDDIDWCKSSFGNSESYIYVDDFKGKLSYVDMHLMSVCKNNIIANSSFSWWGAWLNSNPSKLVCAPSKWFNTDAKCTLDLFPQEWVKL